MPTNPARARKLLKEGRAVVVSVIPFVIRMKHIMTTDGTAGIQGMGLGVDPGSRHTGLAVFRTAGRNRQGLFAVQIDHRSGVITRHMLARAQRHRGRRRRLRYREMRFRHRRRPYGWLAPSLRHRVDGVAAMVSKLRQWFPIRAVHQELVRFDTQRFGDAQISGVEYQQGTLAGYELREYLLEKFRRQCVYCDAHDLPLNFDHVIPKSRGGSDRVANLVLACIPCNDAKGNHPVEEFVRDPVRLARILAQLKVPLRDAAAVNSTRWAIWRRLQKTGLPVSVGSGGQTKFNRTRNGLKKNHWNDALAVGDIETITSGIASVLLADHTGRGSYARTRSDRFGFPRLILPRRKEHYGFITGDTVRAVVPRGKYAGSYTGRVAVRSTGTFAIRTTKGLILSVRHKHCRILQRGAGWYFTTVHAGDAEFAPPRAPSPAGRPRRGTDRLGMAKSKTTSTPSSSGVPWQHATATSPSPAAAELSSGPLASG
ncbi:RNA-guided endonuclease IscB [Arthrobacter sp. Z1-9]